MPFKSEAQRKYMWAKHPEIAREFEEKTPDNKKLPKKVKKAIFEKARQNVIDKAAEEEIQLNPFGKDPDILPSYKIPTSLRVIHEIANDPRLSEEEKRMMIARVRGMEANQSQTIGLDPAGFVTGGAGGGGLGLLVAKLLGLPMLPQGLLALAGGGLGGILSGRLTAPSLRDPRGDIARSKALGLWRAL